MSEERKNRVHFKHTAKTSIYDSAIAGQDVDLRSFLRNLESSSAPTGEVFKMGRNASGS